MLFKSADPCMLRQGLHRRLVSDKASFIIGVGITAHHPAAVITAVHKFRDPVRSIVGIPSRVTITDALFGVSVIVLFGEYCEFVLFTIFLDYAITLT